MLKLAVLCSGSGSNLQSIIDRVRAGVLEADIRVVFSNNPDAYALTRANDAGITALTISHKGCPSREAFDTAVLDALREHEVDTVALAGYMRLLTPAFLEAFPGRVLNIHPAILPSFKGIHGQADAAEYGVHIAGCTVHFVDEIMDNGPIIIQAAVPALPTDTGDTLGARILELEHRIYPQALQWLSEGRLSQEGRKVFLAPSPRPKAFMTTDCQYLVSPPLEDGF